MMNVFDNKGIDHYEFVNAGGNMVDIESAGIRKVVRTSQNVQPTGGLANVFAGGQSNISFLLPQGTSNALDICNDLVLELTLTNNDAVNAATILASKFLLFNIQTLASNQLENSWPEHQLVRELYLANNDEEIIQDATLENFAYTYAGGYTTSATTIAASGTKKLYIRLKTVLDVCGIFLPAIQQQLTIQCYFNSTAVTSTSLSTTVALSNCRLIMNGYRYDANIRTSKLALFASKPHYYKYDVAQREVLSGITVSAVNEASFPVSAFSGFKIPAMFLMVRAANASQEALYAFDKIGEIDMRLNGVSVYQAPLDNGEFVYMAIEAGVKSTVAGSGSNILMLPHCEDVVKSLKHGKNQGFIQYNPNVQEIIRMDTVSGTRDLLAVGFQSCAVKIENGNISVNFL